MSCYILLYMDTIGQSDKIMVVSMNPDYHFGQVFIFPNVGMHIILDDII